MPGYRPRGSCPAAPPHLHRTGPGPIHRAESPRAPGNPRFAPSGLPARRRRGYDVSARQRGIMPRVTFKYPDGQTREVTPPSGLTILEIARRSEEHTSELQSLMRTSYAVFCLKKKNKQQHTDTSVIHHNTKTPTYRLRSSMIDMSYCTIHE